MSGNAKRVEGKVAIVTGGGSGLGAATARALANEGARVLVTDVNAENGEQVAASLGEAARFCAQDVSREDDWVRVIAEAQQRFGGLDILVNNAGITAVATIEDTELSQLQRILEVNVQGVFLGCKHALRPLTARGGGSIVNVSSTAALIGMPPFAAYSASKGAVLSLTKTVAAHCRLRSNGVRCNSIHPGGMATPMVEQMATTAHGPLSSLALEMMGSIGSEPIGEPEDIAEAVLYLSSDLARLVNGAQLVIDNGLTIS